MLYAEAMCPARSVHTYSGSRNASRGSELVQSPVEGGALLGHHHLLPLMVLCSMRKSKASKDSYHLCNTHAS